MSLFSRPHSLLSPLAALLTGALLMSAPADGSAAGAAPKVRMKTSLGDVVHEAARSYETLLSAQGRTAESPMVSRHCPHSHARPFVMRIPSCHARPFLNIRLF